MKKGKNVQKMDTWNEWVKTLLKNSSKGTLNIDSVCVKIRLIMTLEKRLKEITAKLGRPGEPKEIHFLTESKIYSDLG